MFENKSTIIFANKGVIEDLYPIELMVDCKSLKVETYSVSLPFIETMIADAGTESIEIVFGMRDMVLTPDVKLLAAAALKNSDERVIAWAKAIEARRKSAYDSIRQNRVKLWTSKNPSHKKSFLIERKNGDRVAMVGSANASINAVAGTQEEVLTVFEGGPICDALFQRFEKKRDEESDLVEFAERLAWLQHARGDEAY